MSKKHHAIFFDAHPGWLLDAFPSVFDAVGTKKEVEEMFRDFAKELGQYTDTDNLLADVWISTDSHTLNEDVKKGLVCEPDYRLELGPRGGVRVVNF